MTSTSKFRMESRNELSVENYAVLHSTRFYCKFASNLEVEEKEFIRRLIERDENAFRFLIQKYKQSTFKICMGFLHDKDDAEDVTQEVFIEVFQSVHKFREEAQLSSWMYRIAVNKSINFINKRKGSVFLSVKEILGLQKTTSSDPQKDLLIKERNTFLANAIENLPEKQRIAFTLSKFDELSYKEISEIMQTTIPSVESLLHRARLNLQKMLKSYIQEKK